MRDPPPEDDGTKSNKEPTMSEQNANQIEDLDVEQAEAGDVKGGSLNFARGGGSDLQKKATIAVGTPDAHSYTWGS